MNLPGRNVAWALFRYNSIQVLVWCAAFIAAFGEVQESLGNPNAKAQIMNQYQSEYSRRTAFHRELKAYGMKK